MENLDFYFIEQLAILFSINLEIVTIIAAGITIIGILMTVRFSNINKSYEYLLNFWVKQKDEILENETKNLEKKQFFPMDLYAFGDTISTYNNKIEETQKHQKQNKTFGIWLDVSCIVVLLIIGLVLAIYKDPKINVIDLIILGSAIFLPIFYFAIHLKYSSKNVFRNITR